MRAVKVTSKGQVTIPVDIREALEIDETTYLEVRRQDNEVRLRKIKPAVPLSDDDPIWELVGTGRSGHRDVSTDHDRHLAAGEHARWRRSS